MTDPRAFDPVGPLPAGRAVLEASAGTGKTWTIAALVTRYVAEAGVPIERILVVTFTRAATGELRERVRERLASTARALAGDPVAETDAVLDHLLAADEPTRARYLARLRTALAGFDRAAISTLHGFAGRIIDSLGLLAGVPAGRPLEPDHGDLRHETIADLLVARFADADDEPITHGELDDIAKAVLTNPDAAIVPDPTRVAPPARTRAELAARLRPELARRAEVAGFATYDDLLVGVLDVLRDPEVGERAAALAGALFDVALIDEFQDTDTIQWEIADRLLPAGTATLVVIGDPKQAIYAFRGADVVAYLEAVAGAGEQATLGTNWRSDGALITGLDTLFDEVAFGDDRIRHRPVVPAPGHEGSAISGVSAPLTLRFCGQGLPVSMTRNRLGYRAGPIRAFVAADVAAHVVRLLDGAEIDRVPVVPGDIAVLCRTGDQVDQVKAELAARDVPAVVGRTGSVFGSPAAEHWRVLLRALEFPTAAARARLAALGPFIGMGVAELAEADDDDLLPVHDRLVSWSAVLRRRGVPALLAEIERTSRLTERVLGSPDGERTMTDLVHVAELMHRSGRADGARGLLGWLEAELADRDAAIEPTEARARRLETDADAVQVLTVHASKGLEFPIVLVPHLWDPKTRKDQVPVFHPDGHSGRAVDVGGDTWDGFAGHQARALAESEAEDLRLLYVALTRARHHVVVWWARYSKASEAPISRLLFGREPDGGIKDTVQLVSDERLLGHLQPVLDRAGPAMAVEVVDEAPDDTPWAPPAVEPAPLAVADFDRRIDHAWRRSSFTGLKAQRPSDDAEPEPEAAGIEDEPAEEPEPPVAIPGDLPYGDLPGGTRFGSLVHGILEAVDLSADDLAAELGAAVADRVDRSGLDLDPEALVAALAANLATPLGPDPSPRLTDIAPADRVAEMEFELPVATDGGSVSVGDLADLLDAHLPDGHPLAGYPERLRGMDARRFRGFLTGSIDLVLRDGGRFWVVDHKTNRLERDGAGLEAYGPAGLAEAMVHGDYVLQALLYQVALHRHLRLRQPGYDPAAHLAGARYLFLRGMAGPDTPVVAGTRLGVFDWPADPALVGAVDRLFATGGTP